ncbi:MAG: DUF3996 domain-containing protein [Treponema sp.]|jgi:hypothetical protein|nr:DUF3996 domain-containing protein [Treponema sp.]
MAKRFAAFALAAFVVSAGAFAEAQHRAGRYGAGIVTPNGFNWSVYAGRSKDKAHNYGGIGLSLKVPQLPLYWGLYFSFQPSWVRTWVKSDYYLVDTSFWDNGFARIGFFLGGGAYFGWGQSTAESASSLNIGLRVPIGINAFLFDERVEAFFDMAPSIGLGLGYAFGDSRYHGEKVKGYLDGGIPFEIGVVVWF